MAFGVLMGQIAVIFLEVMLGYAGGALRRHHRPGQPVFVGFYHEAAAALHDAGRCGH